MIILRSRVAETIGALLTVSALTFSACGSDDETTATQPIAAPTTTEQTTAEAKTTEPTPTTTTTAEGSGGVKSAPGYAGGGDGGGSGSGYSGGGSGSGGSEQPDTPSHDVTPPPETPQGKFEQFCNENPEACG